MAVTTFIPELWSARLLYALEKSHVATNLVNRNYEGVIANQGDTVHINSIGAITVKDYTKTIAAGAAAGNTVGAASAPVALTKDNVYENIVKLRTKLDKANVPNTGRTLVVPPEVYALLLLDDRFAKSTATSGQDALLNGQVGRVAGFTVFMSNNVKTGTGTDTGKTPYFEITAQVETATTYAEQIIKTEGYRMESRFADGVKGLHVYGAKVTDGNQIAKIIASVA